MKRYFISLAVIITLGTFLYSCRQSPEQVDIKIITTTDVHATLFPYDFIRDTVIEGGFAHLQTYVEQQRSIKGQEVILLDNGDLLQGQPTGYFFNFRELRDINFFADVLNFLGFDAASVGNHDIETGHEVYDRVEEQFNFPWLAANVVDEATGQPYFTPYTIIEKQGIRVAVLGLVTPSVPNWLPRKLWEGLVFEDMMVSAEKWVAYIYENEQPDIVVGLFHSGAGEETTSSGGYAENSALMVGKNVPGIDIVFTGHDHRVRNVTFENVEGKEVIMIAGQSHGRSVAVVDLTFNRTEEGDYKLSSKKGEIVELSQFEPHEDFMKRYNQEYQQVSDFINQSTGRLASDLHSREAFKGTAAFVDFIHDMQLKITGADVSMAAPLSFDAVLKAGEVKMRDMFRLYPFENYLYVMELKGSEIKGALEHSAELWFNTMASPSDPIFNFRKDEQGNVEKDSRGRARFAQATYNFDTAAGIEYTVDVTKPAGQRVNITGMSSGEPFNEDKTYKVAINSYRGSGGGGHLTKGAGIDSKELEKRVVWVSDADFRSQIAEYIKTAGELDPKAGNNWRIIPEDIANPALERDFKLLFP